MKQQVCKNYYTLTSDSERIEQLAHQVTLTQKANEQAKVNYEAGNITNLELLTSSTNLPSIITQSPQCK